MTIMNIEKAQKAVLYCRVSSVKQRVEGDGLASQERRCRDYAAMKGYDVVDVFRDDVSGGHAMRPAMMAMVKFLKTRRKDGLIVIIDDISRFSRDIRGHWDLRDLLREAGGKLESPSIEFGDDSDSVLVENLLASVSQHQRQKNAEQTKNRMKARLQNGYWPFRSPIGYRFERRSGHGKLLVRHEPFASILTDIFEGYASGRFETFSEIKSYLEAQPAWPKDAKGEVHFERIAELFSRPVYAGYVYSEDWGVELTEGKHMGLVSFATWQAAQARREGVAKAPAKKNISEDFPLRGFVTCGCCGHAMTANWSKGRSKLYPYYLCDTKGCPDYRKSIRKEKIEGEFTALLANLKPSEGLFNLAYQMFRDLWNAKLASSQNQGATLRTDIATLEKKIGQLVERVTDTDDPTLIAAYEKKIKELTKDKLLASERIANCGKPLKSFGETYRTAFDFLANPCKLWLSDRLEDRRAVLRLVFAERLPYLRNEGYRTAKISTPFKMLGDANMLQNGMVPRRGLEPPRLAAQVPETCASTNSAIWATDRHVRGGPAAVNRGFEDFTTAPGKSARRRFARPGPALMAR